MLGGQPLRVILVLCETIPGFGISRLAVGFRGSYREPSLDALDSSGKSVVTPARLRSAHHKLPPTLV